MVIEMIENDDPDQCIHIYKKSPSGILECTKCGAMIAPSRPGNGRFYRKNRYYDNRMLPRSSYHIKAGDFFSWLFFTLIDLILDWFTDWWVGIKTH